MKHPAITVILIYIQAWMGRCLTDSGLAVRSVLEASSRSECSFVILSHGNSFLDTQLEFLNTNVVSLSTGLFKIEANITTTNITRWEISKFAKQVRQWRWLYGCVVVIVFSEDLKFLEMFAEESLNGRMAVWSTRLLLVTSFPYPILSQVMSRYWTFSMMNTMFVNLETEVDKSRWTIYSHFPYTPTSTNVVLPIAYWTPEGELTYLKISDNIGLFPQKYNDFFGHQVNITALPWEPYWSEKLEGVRPDGSPIYSYSGSDAYLVKSVAQGLNFTFRAIPVKTWSEVTDRVADRTSFIVGVGHWVMTERLKKYDYSYTYKTIFFGFCMAKPELKPQWQGLYYPLGNQVWLSILAVVILMPILMYMVMNSRTSKFTCHSTKIIGDFNSQHPESTDGADITKIAEEVVFTLLAQNLSGKLPTNCASLFMLGVWLLFAFVVGTAYRGNLTASLTLPRSTSRPETLEELVENVDRITMPPYGEEHRRFFQSSGTEVYRKYASLIYTKLSLVEGLSQAISKRQAQAEDKIVVQYLVAKLFKREDGSIPLYVGREGIMFAPEGLPIPHDAPYKAQVDRIMMAVVEGGLYDKWVDDTLRETQGRLIEEKLEQQALSIIHLQGIFMLLILGYILSSVAFLLENIVPCYYPVSKY